MKARAETVIALQEFRKTNEVPSFEQFFEDGAEAHALAFVKTFGVAVAEECERRGLDKLLKIPSVRVMVGHGMSLIYRIAVEGKVPKGSDSRDLQHALCAVAAAADIFVTHDEELAFLLHRVPVKGFRVLGLHQLLDTGLSATGRLCAGSPKLHRQRLFHQTEGLGILPAPAF